MTEPATSPIAVVHAFLSAAAAKHYDTALAYVSPDCEYENMPMSKVHGPEGIRAVLEPFFASTLENELRILRELASGPLVFTERLDRHRIADRWVELPVTGVWEVRDGLIVLWRDYFDLATLTKAWPELLG